MAHGELHQGTGRYDGLVHDGKRWIDPDTGEKVAITPWEKTGPWGKVAVWAIVVFVFLAVVTTPLYR